LYFYSEAKFQLDTFKFSLIILQLSS